MAGTAKAFGLPFDYVLYDLSYANMILYSSTLPVYDPKANKTDRKGRPKEVIKADDPRNRERVRKFLDSIKD